MVLTENFMSPAEDQALGYRCVALFNFLFATPHCATGFSCSMFLSSKFNVSGCTTLRNLPGIICLLR